MDYSVKTYEELVREEDTLNDEYENLSDECAKNGLQYNEFKEKATPIRQKIYFVSKYKRLKQPPTLEYNKEWNGKLYTIEQFIEMSESGGFMDYDGFGYYATHNAKSDILIYPSDILEHIYRNDFTHIIWFNR
jgi:hypothetical protein